MRNPVEQVQFIDAWNQNIASFAKFISKKQNNPPPPQKKKKNQNH